MHVILFYIMSLTIIIASSVAARRGIFMLLFFFFFAKVSYSLKGRKLKVPDPEWSNPQILTPPPPPPHTHNGTLGHVTPPCQGANGQVVQADQAFSLLGTCPLCIWYEGSSLGLFNVPGFGNQWRNMERS